MYFTGYTYNYIKKDENLELDKAYEKVNNTSSNKVVRFILNTKMQASVF